MPIFDKLKQYLQVTRVGENTAIKRNLLYFPPKHLNGGGRILFDNLQVGGKSIFILPGRKGWNPETEYFKATRDAAKRGNSITRIFLIPNEYYLREPLLQKHYQLDKASGIKIEFAVINSMMPPETQFPLSPGTLDFGIWDNELVSYILYNHELGDQPLPDEWVVSRREEDILIANKNWEIVNDLPRLILSQTNTISFKLKESFLQSAPLAIMLGDYLCKGDLLDITSCAWYHKIHQILKILELIPSSLGHEKFLTTELTLTEYKSDDAENNILICGASDYEILAYVIAANSNKIHPKITIVNLCPTPINLCLWYAAQNGITVSVINENPLNLETDTKYDIITTENLLSMVANDHRLKLLQKWWSLLSDEGKLVLSLPLDETGSMGKISPNEAKEFIQIASARIQLWHEFISTSPELFINSVRAFSEKYYLYAFSSLQEIKNLFTSAGFKILRQEIIETNNSKKIKLAQIVAYKSS